MAMALEGVRVVDVSSGIAGPLAAMLLADFGADVVKVEPPHGDPSRALPGSAVWNRNKRSVVVDRDSASGRRRLAEFLAGADVCIVGEPRAALDGGLLDPAHLCSTYPGLVVAHMPPYTLAEVPWAGGRESHGLLSAIAGADRKSTRLNSSHVSDSRMPPS